MKKSFAFLALLLFTCLWVFIACKKDRADAVEQPKAPIARAGNDTTLYLPFSTYNLNGLASTDPDSNMRSFQWKSVAGPMVVSIDNANTVKAFARGLTGVGYYEFELTVTDADGLSSKDTVKITVAEPTCTGINKEVILKDLSWDYSWIMEIDIYDVFSHLPPNSYLRNIYIKRDASADWERVVPLDYNSPDYFQVPEWEYGNGVLVIFPGKNIADDTPDIKLEYCN